MIEAATVAYAVRLAAWGLLSVSVLGVAAEFFWRLWSLGSVGRSARQRHQMAVAHLAALLVGPAVIVAGVIGLHYSLGSVITREPPTSQLLPLRYANPGTSLILLLWLSGVAAMLAHLVVQYQRLQTIKCWPAPAFLAEEVVCLSRRFGIKHGVPVSIGDVASPQVTGAFMPRLTVPAALVRLTVAEREAVLLHELAHIARRDVAINLAQRVALALIWFQPVAWAMYQRLAAEREACCDQLAIDHGASRAALGRALLSFGVPTWAPVMAMAGVGHGTLAWRLTQLIPTARRVDTPVLPSAVIGALALGMATFCGVRLVTTDPGLTDLYLASAVGPVVAVTARDPAGMFALKIKRGRVIGASVDAKRLPASAILQHAEKVTLLDGVHREIVSFSVTGAGRISWIARRPSAPYR